MGDRHLKFHELRDNLVPCDQPHTGEVVLRDDAYFATETEFSSEDQLFESGTQPCIDALEQVTGQPHETSRFDVIVMPPSQETWTEVGDRGLLCFGVTLNADFSDVLDTTGTLAEQG